jgi:hypothetical protein
MTHPEINLSRVRLFLRAKRTLAKLIAENDHFALISANQYSSTPQIKFGGIVFFTSYFFIPLSVTFLDPPYCLRIYLGVGAGTGMRFAPGRSGMSAI